MATLRTSPRIEVPLVLSNLFSVILFVTFKQTQNNIFCWKVWQHLLVKYFHLPENLVPSCLFFLGIINLDTGSYFCLKIWCNVASFFLGIRNLDKYRLIFLHQNLSISEKLSTKERSECNVELWQELRAQHYNLINEYSFIRYVVEST